MAGDSLKLPTNAKAITIKALENDVVEVWFLDNTRIKSKEGLR